MKTSGVKVEIFPILGEVTCKARDPFSSSLPGESFSLFCVFFSFLLVLCLSFFFSRKPITSPPSSSLLLVRCSFRFSSPVSSSSHSSEAEAAARTEAEQRRTETAEGGSTELHFPAVFRPLQAAIFEARSLLDSNL